MRHEIVDYAHELWNRSGLLADSVRFRAVLDLPHLLYLIVDCDNAGRKKSMMVRCTRSVDLSNARVRLPEVISALYTDMAKALAASADIGVKF